MSAKLLKRRRPKMKKIKKFFTGLLSVLSVLCCFYFVSCNGGEKGAVVVNSLKYSFSVYEYSENVSLNYSFDVSLPSNTPYEVEYDLEIYCKGTRVHQTTGSDSFKPNGETTRRVSNLLFGLPYTANSVQSDYTLSVTNVTVTPKDNDKSYLAYGIGFGVTGGILLVASTVLFIVLKKRESK